MDLDRFVRERRGRWNRLSTLLEQAEGLPPQALGTERLREILALYRQTCSDLNEARALTASPNVLGRLNDLSGRGYRFIYRRAQRSRAKDALRRFFEVQVPAAFRHERGFVAAAAGSLLLGALFGFLAVFVDRGNGERLIPPQFFTESPRARVERIEAGEERIDTVEKALTFGVSLYTHNIRVSFLAFALGAVSIAGGLVLLFYNGVLLGAVAAMYALDGVTLFFLGWVGPHGALEIPAIVFGGAAGLRAGRALLLPGEATRAAALRLAFPHVWRMIVATVLILVGAGVVEGSFSQFSSKTFPLPLKIGVAALLFAALLTYLFSGRSSSAEPA
jgi:uncharacterized membrane protein SpoIIM required for sporulation